MITWACSGKFEDEAVPASILALLKPCFNITGFGPDFGGALFSATGFDLDFGVVSFSATGFGLDLVAF